MEPSQIPRITVDGAPLEPSLARFLVDAVVDDDLYLPDMFELRFVDAERTLLERLPFTVGAEVEITAGRLGADASTLLVNGEVTAVECDLGVAGCFVTITGYDQSHRLHRGRRTSTYNDITDADLARRMAQAGGLAIGTIDPTDATLEHVSQVNETDWSFLQRRAREVGFRVFVKDGRFHLSTDAAPASTPVTVTFGQELLEFRARMTANEQVANVEVRGWDPTQKAAVSEVRPVAISAASLPASSIHADRIDTSFGDATFVTTDLAVGTPTQARAAAEGLSIDLASGQLHATGSVVGDPAVAAGSTITVAGSGKAFDGDWTVSHSRHVFDHLGYTTQFTVSGTQDRSLSGLIAGAAGGAAPAGQGSGRIDGVVIGIVTDTQDPLGIGRVKVALPWLADDFETSWARVCYPGAGPARGLFVCPEVNDEVLIAFEHGDVRQPFVVGGLYNGKDKPDESSYTSSSDGTVTRRPWTSRNGHKIVFLEDPQAPDEDAINIVTKNGVVINVRDDGDLVIDGKNCTIQLQQDFEVASTGDVKISGRNVSIEARSSLDLTALSGATLDGGGRTAIKGGQVALN